VTSTPPDTPSRLSEGEGPPLVLIVDDSQKNLKLTRDVLRAAGFRTLEATNGASAIALAAEHLPNVVLMDLHLPDMPGTDVARNLADGSRTAWIPIVAFSAQPLEGGNEWLLAAGFAGFLEKPMRVTEFPDEVRRYCVDAPG
jgi:two-component system, cell cycle response regulator DivK